MSGGSPACRPLGPATLSSALVPPGCPSPTLSFTFVFLASFKKYSYCFPEGQLRRSCEIPAAWGEDQGLVSRFYPCRPLVGFAGCPPLSPRQPWAGVPGTVSCADAELRPLLRLTPRRPLGLGPVHGLMPGPASLGSQSPSSRPQRPTASGRAVTPSPSHPWPTRGLTCLGPPALTAQLPFSYNRGLGLAL